MYIIHTAWMNNCTHMHTHTDIIHTYIYIPAHSRVIRYNIILLHWTFTFCGHLKARRCENCFEMNARPLCFSRTVSTGQVWKQVEKLLVAWSCLRMHWQAARFFFCVFFMFLRSMTIVPITWAGIFVLAGGGGLLAAGKRRMPCQITIGMWLGYRQLR